MGNTKPLILPVSIITVVTIVTVMAATGKVSQWLYEKENLIKRRMKKMNNLLETSLFAGVSISLVSYMIGLALKKKFKLGIFNPLLISIIFTIVIWFAQM